MNSSFNDSPPPPDEQDPPPPPNPGNDTNGVLHLLSEKASMFLVFSGFLAVAVVSLWVLHMLTAAHELVGSHSDEVKFLEATLHKQDSIEAVAAIRALVSTRVAANGTIVQICAFGMATGFLLAGFALSVFGVRAATQARLPTGLRFATASPGVASLILGAWIASQGLAQVTKVSSDIRLGGAADQPQPPEVRPVTAREPAQDVKDIVDKEPTF